jgi:hypothetical protein
MSRDPLTALNDEYGAEWNVRYPGRYVADHRRLDMTLISDSVPELSAYPEVLRVTAVRPAGRSR